ncbi:MAG: DUF89 family protein [Candidatus Hydrogenedentes bacterium]|nr:DUF89 family protein [Candidatus Hydrogenedentota bacterium]
MKSTLDCLECIVRQALRASRVATTDPAVQRQIIDETSRRIGELDLEDSPASVSMMAYEITSQLSGNADPYRELKWKQNELALAMEPALRHLVDAEPDRLEAALHIAAAGNVIDLGVMTTEQIDVEAAVTQVMHERFAVDHSAAFKASLSRCKDLLYLLDNAGEIVFDKILIEELQKHTRVTAVVKAGPMINDVLREDAEQVGLTQLCEVIDNGGAFIGSPLHRVPQAFLDRMAAADMIVGKGQGNYETVDDFDGDVFLILRAKCEIVAAHMGVKYGQVGLISTRVRNSGGVARV